MNVLVLQPTRPETPTALRVRACELLEAMIDANPGMTFEVVCDDRAIDPPVHQSRYLKHALLRNALLEAHLRREHDYVLWIDSDLVTYPADLPTRLYEANPGGITAPLVLLAPTPGRLAWDTAHGFGTDLDRFYDLGGFVEHGHSVNARWPFFQQRGDLVDLDSVGSCYLAPASLYRDHEFQPGYVLRGVRYTPPAFDAWRSLRGRIEHRVEHNAVMAEAAQRGIRIACLTTIAAVHAWLPDYGLEVS